MKTRLGFLKQIRFIGIIVLILFAISIFLVYSNSYVLSGNVYTTSKISDVSVAFLEDNVTVEMALADKDNIEYGNAADLGLGKFGFFDPKNVLVKMNISPIAEGGTYFLIGSNRETKQYMHVFLGDKKLVNIHPQLVSYNPKGQYSYYLLPKSSEELDMHIYFDKGYGANGFSKPSFLVGTETELILMQGYHSITNIVFAGVLVLLGVFIYIVFYITRIEKYHVVKVFALAFFLISIQSIIYSPFVTFILNEYFVFFDVTKVVIYYLICALCFTVQLVYTKSPKMEKFYWANIIVAIFSGIGASLLIYRGNYIAVTISSAYNVFFMFECILSLVINLYNYEDETDASSIFRLLSFSALSILNMFFFYYETENSASTYTNPYYYVLMMLICSVIVYIASIFYYRGKSIRDTKMFLYDEKETIDRLYKSNKNAIKTTNIEQISENILSDVKGIYPNLKVAMIIHRDLNRKITIPAHTEFKGDIEHHANRIFKKFYKKIPKSKYTTNFSADTAVICFKSSTGEGLIIFVRNNKTLTELDQVASEILASPVLLSFNNCRIYDEIANTEKELLLAIGNLTYHRSGLRGNIWRVGEYAYLLAKNTGLDEQVALNLRVASYVHDIGKVGISDEYTNREKISAKDEFLFYQHANVGYDMLTKFGGNTMRLASMCALYHHEHYNGKGYLGKVAEEIPIEARIVIICIEFENFYANTLEDSKDLSQEELLEKCYSYLSVNKQTFFDPLLVQLFIKDKNNIEKIIKASKNKVVKFESNEELNR